MSYTHPYPVTCSALERVQSLTAELIFAKERLLSAALNEEVPVRRWTVSNPQEPTPLENECDPVTNIDYLGHYLLNGDRLNGSDLQHCYFDNQNTLVLALRH